MVRKALAEKELKDSGRLTVRELVAGEALIEKELVA